MQQEDNIVPAEMPSDTSAPATAPEPTPTEPAPENPAESPKKKSPLALILLALLAVLGLGFGVYAYFFAPKPTCPKCPVCECNCEKEDTNTTNTTNESAKDCECKECEECKTASADERYAEFLKAAASRIPIFGRAEYGDILYTFRVDENHHLSVSIGNKLDPEIIYEEDGYLLAYSGLSIGNGGIPGVLLIKDDGNAYYGDITGIDFKEFKVQKIEGVKNIVSAVETGGVMLQLIDIDGNITIWPEYDCGVTC